MALLGSSLLSRQLGGSGGGAPVTYGLIFDPTTGNLTVSPVGAATVNITSVRSVATEADLRTLPTDIGQHAFVVATGDLWQQVTTPTPARAVAPFTDLSDWRLTGPAPNLNLVSDTNGQYVDQNGNRYTIVVT